MKQKFTESLFKSLIKEKGFTPLADEEGNISIYSGVNILAKDSFGTLSVIELIDGDMMTAQEIEARLQENKAKMEVINGGENNFIFEVFFFEAEPDKEKLDIIEAGQLHSVKNKRFLKCITVSLASQEVKKHFKIPLTDFSIEKLIKEQFENGNTDETSIEEIAGILQERENALRIDFKAKTSILTYALIVINILVAGLIALYGLKTGTQYGELLITFGAKENAKILAGEYWRFITPIFLHADLMHLAVNCYSLIAVGMIVEKIFGYSRFFLIYFAAGIFGNIASFMFSTNPGVGASGAIFGLMGAMLYFGLEKPAQFKAYFSVGIITSIAINLFYGFSRSGIDNFAHLGGLVGGFLAAGIVGQAYKNKWYLNRAAFLILTAIMAYSGLFYGTHNKENRALVKVEEMERLDQAQQWEETEKLGEEILALRPRSENIKVRVLWSVIKAEVFTHKFDEGMKHVSELVSIDPPNGHYLQGVLYLEMGRFEEAKTELLKAKELGARYEAIDELVRKADELKNGAS